MAISAAMVWQTQSGGSDTACSSGFRGGAYVAAPSAPTVNGSATGGTVAAGTYYIVITYTDGVGETVISGETSVVLSGATSKFTVTSPASSTGATSWNCYVGTTTGGPYFPQGTTLTIGSDRIVTITPPTSGTQPRGVDYTLQNGAQITIENSAITATTTGANSNTLTFTLGFTPTGALVGNTLRTTGGTNININTFEITAVTSTTLTVTGSGNLTTAGGSGSAITGVIGGAHATPGQALVAAVTSNIVYIKPGTYTLANGTVNTAGNKLSTNGISLIGYSTNRYPGNTDTQPVLDAGAASMTMLAMSGNGYTTENLSFTNSGARASITAISQNTNNSNILRRISVTSCATPFTFTGFSSLMVDCVMTSCGPVGGSSTAQRWLRCTSLNATGAVFPTLGGWSFEECVVVSPAGNAFNLGVGAHADNCIAYGATSSGHGFVMASGAVTVANCIAYGNAGTGFQLNSGLATNLLDHCAAGGNGTDFDANWPAYAKISCATLSASPFTAAGSNDFSLNTTVGGGASCRTMGIPGVLRGLSTTGYRDIGAVQHADPASGGVSLSRVFTGM